MGKHRSSGAPAYDQFGELGLPQDREESQRQGQRQGQRFGGGGASGPSPIVYERHVPKFLQPYAHLIDKRRNPFDGGGGGEEAGARGRAGLEQAEDGDDDRDQAEAIQRALEENPELAKELGSEVVDKARALAEKEAGNEAFSEGRYEDAVKRFTECIKLDGSNEIYYSNRSAAHAKAGDFPSALRDAEAALRLKPRWVKGWARKAAALQGLNYHSEAKEAYERALEIEPDDETLRKGYEKVRCRRAGCV
ncbi:unnamed protein product [Ostreobium quekettii]|uniref:Uncharacterized protein n=1 Tax=Ostreobium quekettii TaxID=121088 RepID=A0A8S1J288_9CHLO|nr:unnamed protein product [Ostreobium quekettii]